MNGNAVDQTGARRFFAGLVAMVLVALGLVAAPAAQAASTPIAGAALFWGGSWVQQGIAYANGCDHFSAGISDGSSAAYSAHEGNVYVLRELADGTLGTVGWSNRCDYLGVAGADGDATNGQRIVFTEGAGTQQDDGSLTITWQGDASVNAYGGLAPWSISDPVLKVDSSGKGQITATLSGFATSQASAGSKTPLNAVENAVIANLTGVHLDDQGVIQVTPDFVGVDYFPLNKTGDPALGRSTVSAVPASRKTDGQVWGAWPESFVDFQYQTGLSSYWHTSGGSSDSHKGPVDVEVRTDFDLPELTPTITRGVPSVTASTGEHVVLHAPLVANPVPAVQWQSRAGSSSAWQTIADESGLELDLGAVTDQANGTQYRIGVASGDSITYSGAGTLTVVPVAGPTITRQPESRDVGDHDDVTVSAEATGSVLRYQWQEKLSQTSDEWRDIVGATGTSYSYISALAQPWRSFRVRITNGVDAPVNSEAAVVRVGVEAPVITTHPGDVEALVTSADKYTLTAAASGSPEPNWIWQRSDDAGLTWVAVTEPSAASKSSSFSVNTRSARFTVGDAGAQYRAVADNGSGEPAYSDAATLTIHGVSGKTVSVVQDTAASKVQVTIAGYPVDKTVSGLLQVSLVKVGDWTPGVALDSSQAIASTTYSLSNLAAYGGTRAFTFSGLPELDPAVEYEVVTFRTTSLADEAYQGRKSLSARTPAITAQPTSTRVLDGTQATFQVASTDQDLATTTYQWQRWLAADPWWEDVAGATQPTLSVEAALADDGAVYRVVVSGSGGAVESRRAALSVDDWLPLTVTDPAAATVAVGASATFRVTAGGTSPQIQWETAARGSSSWTAVAGATEGTLVVPSLTFASNGARYRAVVSNARGSVTSTEAVLTVAKNKPTATLSGAPAKAVYGSTVKLVAASNATGASVTFLVDGRKAGVATVTSGKAALVVAGLKPGTHAVTAQVAETASTSAASARATVTVRKAKASSVKVTAKKKRIAAGKRAKVVVSVPRLDNGQYYTGTVAIVSRGKVVKTATIRAGKKGKVTVKLPRATKKLSVKARIGSSTVSTKTSKSVTIKVVKKGS